MFFACNVLRIILFSNLCIWKIYNFMNITNKINIRTKLIIIILSEILAIVFYLSPCHSKDTIVLQLAWKHQFQFAGYYAALHKGFYKQANLDVTIVEGGMGRFAREEVLSGNAQYGIAGAELILHRAEANPFVVLATIFQHSASIILTRKDSNITHPQDLIGKRLMLLPGNKDADILAILQKEGIPLSQIHRMDQSYNIEDLVNGHVDAVSAYVTNEPWYLKQKGIEPGIIWPQTYGVDFYSDCLFTTDMEIRNHPERVKKFLQASLSGWDYSMMHPEEIIEILIRNYPVNKGRDHLRFEAHAMKDLIFPSLVEMGHMNEGRWHHIADTFALLGELPANFSLQGFLYDPDPKIDIHRLKLIIFSLILGFLAASLLIIYIIKINHKLSCEVAERKKTEQTLRESETRLRTIFETSRAGILLVDKKGVIIFANQGLAEMFAYPLNKIIGINYSRLVHPDQRYVGNNRMKQLIAGNIDAVELERHYIRMDGSDFWGFLSGKRHEKADGKLISLIGIIADITERKKLEYDLRQAQKMESIGTLTGGVAHDFNNLLTAVIGNTDIVLDDLSISDPHYETIDAVRSAALRAADIVKQLLDFSRKTDPSLKSINLISMIRHEIKFLRSMIPTNIEIVNILPEQDLFVLADPVQIRQVLLNICTNASHVMASTGGILRIIVKQTNLEKNAVEKMPPGNYVKIEISDNGPGINQQIIHRIFEPYFTTKAGGKGSGMGLAVVHGIVKTHGGTINVDSQPEKGTRFTILLPIIKEQPIESLPVQSSDIPSGNESILFIDDESAICKMSQKMLSKLGYQVEISQCPLEALKTFESNPQAFDLIISDMTMPKMTGIVLCEKIKTIRIDIPVIICTGYSALINEDSVKEIGVDILLMKPLVKHDLAVAIRQLLDN